MAYNEKLAERVRTALANETRVEEKRMFGGLAFMVRGNMTCGIVGDDLMLRVGEAAYGEALKKPHTRPMDFTGKPMKGMLYVAKEALRNQRQIDSWVQRATRFTASLPEKKRKTKADGTAATRPTKATSKPRGTQASKRRTKTSADSSTHAQTEPAATAKPAAAAPVKPATTKPATVKPTAAATAKPTPAQAATTQTATTQAATAFTGFPDGTFEFLKGLEQHNDKAWFEAHRREYEQFYVAPALALVEALGPRLQELAPGLQYATKINGSLFRIHRDTRFSKDKTPYKTHLDLWFWEGAHRGFETMGFFFRLTPKTLLLGVGMHRFDKTHLEAYRKAVLDKDRGAALVRLLRKIEKAGPYQLGKSYYKKVPRGVDPEHPRSALLLHDSLHVVLDTKLPKEARSAAFVDYVIGHFEVLAPLYRWLLTL